MRLHRAPWVVRGVEGPASKLVGNLVADGGVLVENGRILAVDSFKTLKKEQGWCLVTEHEACILAPALVNAHAHLELSHLAELGQRPAGIGSSEDFTDWIRNLLALRQEKADSDETTSLVHGRRALDLLDDGGVGLVADIGNFSASRLIGNNHRTRVLFLLEMLGLSRTAEKEALRLLAGDELPADMCCTAHAPYSTGSALIRQLKKRAATLGHVFSIHAAETVDEVEFLQTGFGSFREFIEERGGWDGSFVPPGCGAISYLSRLDVLDSRSLCVHAVHVTVEEIDLLAKARAGVCLCPGSNRRLKVGKAPAPDFLARGILPALGTDSLASNQDLSIWREMRILREDHPALDPVAVFAMATRGGVEALGYGDRLGGLLPGGPADVIAVRAPGLSEAGDIFEYLTTVGGEADVSWVG